MIDERRQNILNQIQIGIDELKLRYSKFENDETADFEVNFKWLNGVTAFYQETMVNTDENVIYRMALDLKTVQLKDLMLTVLKSGSHRRLGSEKYVALYQWYRNHLKAEARYNLDSYCLFIEMDRPVKERFYEPRRKSLKQVVDYYQAGADGLLDELFVHMPPRVGKTQIATMFCAWYCAKYPNKSSLYVTYKESLGGAFLDGVMSIWTDPMYLHSEVFPETKIVSTDSKNHKIDLCNKRKYKTISGKGLESGLNGEYDATGLIIVDDILEGIQDVMNKETLKRKQIIFDNNLMSRKKSGCLIVYNGTIWSLKDIFSDRYDFLVNNPSAKSIRHKRVKIPALNENDESNFNYDYGLGFSSDDYKIIRAKMEENDDIASWMAQYQQEPIEREGAVFNSENMHFYNGVLPTSGLVRVCAACDVALGGGDYLSCVVACLYEDGKVYIPDVVFSNETKEITQPLVIDLLIRNEVGSVKFESNQGGEGYAQIVDLALRKQGKRLNIVTEYAPSNKRKEQRIWDSAPQIKEFYFLEDGRRSLMYRKFMANVFSFTVNGKNKNDDAPDSLALLCSFIDGKWIARTEAMRIPW